MNVAERRTELERSGKRVEGGGGMLEEAEK